MKYNVRYDPYAMICRTDNNWTVGDCGSQKLEKTWEQLYIWWEATEKNIFRSDTFITCIFFSLNFFWKGKKYMKSIVLSLNIEYRLERYSCHRTATCSMYNCMVWVCTRTTALSCYLLMINDIILWIQKNNSDW